MKKFNPVTYLIAVVILDQLRYIECAATLKIPNIDTQGHNSSSSEDIHVEAFVRDKRILQLNVTLTKEIGSYYDIAIASLPTNRSTDHCSNLQNCVVHGIVRNQLSVTFPINAEYITDHEYCQFQNDCSYKITASAVSGKATNVISTVYHIKECVNGLCLCKNTENLPKPLLHAELDSPRRLSYGWEIIENQNHSVKLQYLAIDIEEMRDCNISWSGTNSIESYHAKLDNYGTKIRKRNSTQDIPNNTEARCVQIRLSVYDSQLCKGPEVSAIVHLPAHLPPIGVHENISFQLILICLVAIFTTAAVVLIVYVFFWKTRKKNVVNYWRGVYHNVQNGGTVMTNNPLYFEKEDDDWFEIPHSNIKEIGREIGKGAFGRVYVARISDIPNKLNSQVVAIKKLKKSPTTDQLEEFLGEIATMKKVGKHPNIVRLLGFCTVEQPLMMIMEFVPCGDLLKYLRKVRSKHEERLARANKVEQNANCINNSSIKHSSSSHSQILGPLGKYSDIMHPYSTSSASESSSYVSQPVSLPSTAQINGSGPCISRPSFAETLYTNFTNSSNPELTGMLNTSLEYVVDHTELHNFAVQIARGMSHLQKLQITHRDLAARNVLIDENKTLKISDFGLSRSGIYVNTKNKKVPLRWLSLEAMKDNLYSSKSDVWAFAILLWEIGTLGGFPYPTVCNLELLNYLKSGQRLERPENCSESLYELMLQCWAADPEDRPDFSDICRKLDPNKNKIYIDFNELSPNYVFPPTSEEISAKNVAEKLSKI